jgi:hypothetical protein
VAERRRQGRELLRTLKLEKGCARCGYREHASALDLHHTSRSTKSFNITQALSRSLTRLAAEAEKCIVLCANCHRIEHAR